MYYICIMDSRKYKQIRAAVAGFVACMVSVSVTIHSYILAFAAVVTGMTFLLLVRSKAKIVTDEREISIKEKAANLTYAIFTPVIGLGSFLMLLPSNSGLSVFAKGDFVYLESLGMVFAYLTLFLITIYSISYYYLSRKFGGNGDD